MSPVKRGCLYGVAVCSAMFGIFHLVDVVFDRAEARYWARH